MINLFVVAPPYNPSGINIAPDGGFKGFGPLGNVSSGQTAITTFAKFLSSIIGLITIVAALWFIFVFITGAIALMGAGGDKQALESAKKKLTTGIIGITVTVIAIFLIRLITQIIGIPDILNLPAIFTQITTQ